MGSTAVRGVQRERWGGRVPTVRPCVLFRLYYLGLAPYENARHFLGLSEHSWVNWTEQIRNRCGKELLGRGMFPPRRYFVSSAYRIPGGKDTPFRECKLSEIKRFGSDKARQYQL